MFRDVLVVTLKLYDDESTDETKSRAFAVASVIGSEDEWALVIHEWLRRTRGLPFHAKYCESQYGRVPDNPKHQENLKLYADLTTILASSHLIGFAYALDLQSYRDIFPGVGSDWACYKGFADLIRESVRTARDFNENLSFTFDSRLESNGTAGTLYTMMATHPDWRSTGIFDTKVSFDSGDPRLEVGDLLARESMKELDRKLTRSARPIRRSRKALDNAIIDGRRKFNFAEKGREYWLTLRDMAEKPEATELTGRGEWRMK